MHLILIRHGQSQHNADDKLMATISDPALTEIGQQQAALVARYVADRDWGVTHLLCSPMLRAMQTALPIGQALAMQPHIWVDLHERGGVFTKTMEGEVGTYQGARGLTRARILADFPGYVLADTITEEGWYTVDGPEPLHAFFQRALNVVLRVRTHAREHPDSVVVLVSHGGFLDRLMKGLLNQLPGPMYRQYYPHHNGGLTRVHLDEEAQPLVLQHNNVEFLPQALRT